MKLQTSIRVDETFFHESKEVFAQLGITFTDAVNIFLAKVAMEKRIPFELAVEPSADLRARVNNIAQGKNLVTYDNVDALFADLDG